MNRLEPEVLQALGDAAVERGIEREVIFEALEAALEAVKRREILSAEGAEAAVRVSIDRDSGAIAVARRWQVVSDDDPEFVGPDAQCLLSTARRERPELAVGDYIEEPAGEVGGGRIIAHTVQQVLTQKVREAERAQTAEAYADQVGELLTGIVKRVEHQGAYVDLGGNAEAFIPREDMIPREIMRMGDRLRAYLREVREEVRGPQLILSRTVPEFLIRLFHLEVPEIDQGLIEIVGAARDPGMRAKIAVRTNDSRLDPVGACVGMRGARVQAVSNELSGERIDIITWHENVAQYVINAMSLPAVDEIVQDEELRVIDLAIEEEKLSQAIGRGGQNVRLASQLTGWSLNVMTPQELREKMEKEQRSLEERFQEELDVDEHIAAILVENGFREVQELAAVPEAELLQVEEFNEQIVAEIKERARDSLSQGGSDEDDLLDVAGMDTDLALQLAAQGITTRRMLAELSVDELPDIEELDEERGGELIMNARANLVLTLPADEPEPS